MKTSTLYGKSAGALAAEVVAADSGSFVAVASTGDIDRDGERIIPGCFTPLPDSVPVHLGHDLRPENVVARAVPRYVGNELRIDARFGSGEASQKARRLLAEGLIDSVSIVFRGLQWRDVGGVRTCTRGELLAVDLVSIPSQANARVLSVRGVGSNPTVADARRLAGQALLAAARAELTDARRVLKSSDPRGTYRRAVDDLVFEALGNPPAPTKNPLRSV